jgi:tetratricopeptide (TPR) repeat protein
MSKKVDYQKKYWWLILVVVPIVVATIAAIPPFLNALKPAPSPLPPVLPVTNNKFASDLYFITKFGVGEDAAKTPGAQQVIQRATGLVQDSNYANAISLLEQAAAQYQLPTIYNNLGVLYANAGNLQKAEEAYQSALKIDPNDQVANFNLGLLKQAQGKLGEAAGYYDKAPDLKKPPEAKPTPSSSPESKATPSSFPESTTQVPGVTAQLIEFSRFQNTITVKVRLINSTAKDSPRFGSPIVSSHLLDEAAHTEYQVTDQSNNWVVEVVPANNSVEIWGKYDLPSNDDPQFLSVVLGSGILFEHVPVSTKRCMIS